ncbi:hypothetical protein [Nesterenkonia flava]|uniref:Multidrug ABC transporter ATPase n=1 Tax=Nesterenkonia flava TaxID=469799 RepID=A0ABU1FVC4_9MICC|nr:hypothetical protein [Nesterenkonia flava]MDR5712619.1 hypothetical protein [Nesterenkonia flava]
MPATTASRQPLPARLCLILGVVVTAASFVALLVILGFYFAGSSQHPQLFGTALWGFPVGFTLMCLYVIFSLGRRRRLSPA